MATADLSLPKSNIQVADGQLIVHSSDNEIIAKHSLDSIEELRAVKCFEPISIVFGLFGICLAYFPLFYVEGAAARWSLVGFGAVCIVLALFGAIGTKLAIRISGKELRYTVNDLPEHAEGFALTVKEMINGAERSPEERPDFPAGESHSRGPEVLQ